MQGTCASVSRCNIKGRHLQYIPCSDKRAVRCVCRQLGICCSLRRVACVPDKVSTECTVFAASNVAPCACGAGLHCPWLLLPSAPENRAVCDENVMDTEQDVATEGHRARLRTKCTAVRMCRGLIACNPPRFGNTVRYPPLRALSPCRAGLRNCPEEAGMSCTVVYMIKHPGADAAFQANMLHRTALRRQTCRVVLPKRTCMGGIAAKTTRHKRTVSNSSCSPRAQNNTRAITSPHASNQPACG